MKARSKGEHCHHQKASEALNWDQRGTETSTELRDITMKNEAMIVSTRRRNRRRKLYSHHARLRRIPLLFLSMLVTVCGDDVKETETGAPFLAGVPTLGPSLSPYPSLIPPKVPDVSSVPILAMTAAPSAADSMNAAPPIPTEDVPADWTQPVDFGIAGGATNETLPPPADTPTVPPPTLSPTELLQTPPLPTIETVTPTQMMRMPSGATLEAPVAAGDGPPPMAPIASGQTSDPPIDSPVAPQPTPTAPPPTTEAPVDPQPVPTPSPPTETPTRRPTNNTPQPIASEPPPTTKAPVRPPPTELEPAATAPPPTKRPTVANAQPEPTTRPPTSKPPTTRPPTTKPPTSRPPTSRPPTAKPPTEVVGAEPEPTMAAPDARPTTSAPVSQPTAPVTTPTAAVAPTVSPTQSPAAAPSTAAPSASPSSRPSPPPGAPTIAPTVSPRPSASPSAKPSVAPTKPQLTLQRLEAEGIVMTLTEMEPIGMVAQSTWVDTTAAFIRTEIEDMMQELVPDEDTKVGVSIDITAQSPAFSKRRKLRNLQTNQLEITFNAVISIESSVEKHDVNSYILGAFDTPEEEEEYIATLKATMNESFAALSDVSVEPATSIAPLEDPNADNGNDSKLSDAATIGLVAGLATVGVVGFALAGFVVYSRRKNKGKRTPVSSLDEDLNDNYCGNEIDIEMRDEVSTLGDPIPVGMRNDFLGEDAQFSITTDSLTADYDFQQAYRSGQPSVVDSHTGSDPSSFLAKDDITLEAEYQFEAQTRFEVEAPAGLLGLVLETSEDGVPVVHAIKESSCLAGQVQVGDRLVCVDDEDVTSMLASSVSRLIASKKDNPIRTFVFTRPVEK